MEKQHPLVLVFYLDRQLVAETPQILTEYAASINELIARKELNAISFFLPTDGPERVDCINPVSVPENEMERIQKILGDITKQFDINPNIPDQEIKLEDE